MKPLRLSLLAALALAGVVASASGADEPAATTPVATTPTSPATTTPTCPVSGPASSDRSAPLRAGLPAKQTFIALTREEQRKIPDPVPTKINSHVKKLGAWLLMSPPEADGSVSQKVPWLRDRRATGRLHVSGKRIDGQGRLSVYINRRYGGKTFAYTVPGDLTFSTTGCWRVKARAGDERVTYVVLVRRPSPGEFAPYLP